MTTEVIMLDSVEEVIKRVKEGKEIIWLTLAKRDPDWHLAHQEWQLGEACIEPETFWKLTKEYQCTKNLVLHLNMGKESRCTYKVTVGERRET